MDEDFGFYGSEAELEEVKDIKGITDEVSKYVYTDMDFPCICLKGDINLPMHKWKVISKLVKEGSANKNITFYIIKGNELFRAGALAGIQVMPFIDIVGLENLEGFHNKEIKLEGDRLYVLAGAF